jgi:hypothetical protein
MRTRSDTRRYSESDAEGLATMALVLARRNYNKGSAQCGQLTHLLPDRGTFKTATALWAAVTQARALLLDHGFSVTGCGVASCIRSSRHIHCWVYRIKSLTVLEAAARAANGGWFDVSAAARRVGVNEAVYVTWVSRLGSVGVRARCKNTIMGRVLTEAERTVMACMTIPRTPLPPTHSPAHVTAAIQSLVADGILVLVGSATAA